MLSGAEARKRAANTLRSIRYVGNEYSTYTNPSIRKRCLPYRLQ